MIVGLSCKSYREFLELEYYNVPNAKDSIVDGLYIHGFINNQKAKFLFDTGSTSTVVENLDLLGGKDILNSSTSKKIITAKGADGIEMSLYKIKSSSLSINTYKSKNRYFVTFDKKQIKNNCIKDLINSRDAILGLDAFIYSETPVLLDYENNILLTLDNNQIPRGYVQIDSEIRNNRIILKADINNVKISLLFDTGNNDYIILSKNPFSKEQEDIAYETGMMTANQTKSYPLNKVYINRPINIGGIKSDKNRISVIESFKTNGVGIQFINKYNWIIDFKKKKLYAKKIKDFEMSEYLEKMSAIKYKVLEMNGSLIIFHKNDPQNKFNVGDEIVSVDDIIISKDNICEL